MGASNLKNNKHLLLRAGFGPSLQQTSKLEQWDSASIWKDLKKQRPFSEIKVNTDFESAYSTDNPMQTDKQMLMKLNRQKIAELNQKFFNEMVNSEYQLQEKMAFFWHGHFATRTNSVLFNAQILQIFREKGLGKFSDLLFAVSKSPAMLQFLNNQQNKKGHPNENFAREVMELFTMGRNNYTEKDIKEAARAYTGWAYDKEGNFVFRKNQHDDGQKTFLGKTGNFTGEDVLNIILEQPATAEFICTKIYKFFVNDTPDPDKINFLSTRFRNSGYDILALLQNIFSSDWFYKKENIGAKIKSPIELMVGMLRVLPIEFDSPQSNLFFQKTLGQLLFYPPNVAGWPSGTSWIDSTTLLLRMQLPQIWTGLQPLEMKSPEFDDIDMGMKQKIDLQKVFNTSGKTIHWDLVESQFQNKNLQDYLLQVPSATDVSDIEKYSDHSTKSKIINIMSLPEYQLC